MEDVEDAVGAADLHIDFIIKIYFSNLCGKGSRFDILDENFEGIVVKVGQGKFAMMLWKKEKGMDDGHF